MLQVSSLFLYKLMFMVNLIAAQTMFLFRLNKKPRYGVRITLCTAFSFVFVFFFPILAYNALYSSFMFFTFFVLTILTTKTCYDINWRSCIFCTVAGYSVQHLASVLYDIVITVGLAAAIVEALTGITLIPGMNPIEEGYATVGGIAIVLAGAFPLVFVITKVFRKPLMRLGHLLGMNDIAAAGLVATLANNIPMFQMMGDMDRRGKIINVAFAVSAAFVFGDHLGFTAGFDAAMIFPMIVGKLVGGVTAVAAAMLLTRKEADHG